VIEAVGVVVPARNEELLLPACLDSIAVAAAAVSVRVHVVVVLDGCTDATDQVVAGTDGFASQIALDAGNVGVARAAGMSAILRRERALRRDRLWLATTDADSTVPADWLTCQLSYEAGGADVVVGTVRVTDWTGHAPRVPARFASLYATAARPGHPHVHGANMGLRASAYLQSGGLAPLALDEDHALVAACAAAGVTIERAADLPVTTSARRRARASGGFADLLARLALESEAS